MRLTAFVCAALVAGIGLSSASAQEPTAPLPTPPVGTTPAAKLVTRPMATVVTAKGTFVIALYPEDAPLTVQNFVTLAKQGFYNGLTFHRVVPGFVIQGGDPQGNGLGGPGYEIKSEKNKILKHDVGTVAMANSGRDTAGSQFYVVITKPAPNLDEKFADGVNKYTMFGRVVSGQDVAEKITRGDIMTTVTIEEPAPTADGKPVAPAPSKETRVAEPFVMIPVIVPYLDRPVAPKNTKPKVKVAISAEGRVSKVSLQSKTGVAELDKAVTDALGKWQWSAALKDGKRVASERTFVYDIINRSVRYN